MKLIMGEGTDFNTIQTFFGHLTVGYVVELNGVDMVVDDLASPDGDAGIYGYLWDPETSEPPRTPYGVEWDDIEKLVIY